MPEPIAVSSASPAAAPSQSVSNAPAAPVEARRKARRVSWPLIVCAALGLTTLVGIGTAYGAYTSWKAGDHIAPGVLIAGEDVSGLTQTEAAEHLQKRFGRLFLTVNTDARPFKVSLGEIGGAPSIAPTVEKAYSIGRSGTLVSDFARVYGSKTTGTRSMLPLVWSKPRLVAKLNTLDSLYRVEAKNARIRVVNGLVQVESERMGREINIGETAKRLQATYYVGLTSLDAATRAAQPKVRAADLRGENVKLASYTTSFNAGQRGRTVNVHIAAGAIDGRVLMPGETFSFNKSTGERTADKGYRMAHIFLREPGAAEAEVVDGLAGGTCQVSSTLFNAVRKTNNRFDAKKIKIVERNTHSLPVTYVPRGLDATVAWPYKDLRFRNNFDYPIYLRTTFDGARLTAAVWGYAPSAEATRLVVADVEDSSRR